MVLDTALGSGVNEPLIDVGEAWTIDGRREWSCRDGNTWKDDNHANH